MLSTFFHFLDSLREEWFISRSHLHQILRREEMDSHPCEHPENCAQPAPKLPPSKLRRPHLWRST